MGDDDDDTDTRPRPAQCNTYTLFAERMFYLTRKLKRSRDVARAGRGKAAYTLALR